MDDMQQGNMHQNSLDDFMHNAFWLEDRISVTFKVSVPGPVLTLPMIMPDLRNRVDALNALIKQNGIEGVSLHFFDSQNMESDNPDNAPPGVYLFGSKPGLGPDSISEAQAVSFLRLDKPASPPPSMSVDTAVMASVAQIKLIPRIVNLINENVKARGNQQGPSIGTSSDPVSSQSGVQTSVSSSAPTYLCGASDQVTQGCPLSPPIPVPVDASCSSDTGRFPFSFPELPKGLQSMTGKGVTVFVLDTLPARSQITEAAMVAGQNNTLLKEVDQQVSFSYPTLTDGIDTPGPEQPHSGKDIHGRMFGFDMPDHGLFVAGIMHDLAPDASIECIRVLNDKCAGSVSDLVDALDGIQKRMMDGGNLHNKPVVINMSLVIPGDDTLESQGLIADPALPYRFKARENLLTVIQSLVDLKAVFVASAGNEGDLRNPLNAGKARPLALYPAAYGEHGLVNGERMIAVGAVNKDGNAATYSCYPGEHGFATYGGEVPQANEIEDGQGYDMTSVKEIDAPIGLYSSPLYPALSKADPQLTYPTPNTHGWARWIGTSFATPIVTAVTARAMQLAKSRSLGVDLPDPSPFIHEAATRQTDWTNLPTGAVNPTTGAVVTNNEQGSMIWVTQCQTDEDEGKEVQVEINITEVNVVYEQ